MSHIYISNKLLVSLAIRKGSIDPDYWREGLSGCYSRGTCLCYYCNKYVNFMVDDMIDGIKIMSEHGIMHLKEHNLLAFI